MRIAWSDGSVVILGSTPKGASKSVLPVQHTKLPSEAARERLKAYWAERLGVLAEVLSG